MSPFFTPDVDRLVQISPIADPSLSILESAQRAGTLAEAEAKTLHAVAERLPSLENSAARPDEIVIVTLPLNRDFFAPRPSAGPQWAKVFQASRTEGKWEIIVEGQWRAKVLLDDRYKVLATERLP